MKKTLLPQYDCSMITLQYLHLPSIQIGIIHKIHYMTENN